MLTLPKLNNFNLDNCFVLIVNFHNRFIKALMKIFQFRRALLFIPRAAATTELLLGGGGNKFENLKPFEEYVSVLIKICLGTTKEFLFPYLMDHSNNTRHIGTFPTPWPPV